MEKVKKKMEENSSNTKKLPEGEVGVVWTEMDAVNVKVWGEEP